MARLGPMLLACVLLLALGPGLSREGMGSGAREPGATAATTPDADHSEPGIKTGEEAEPGVWPWMASAVHHGGAGTTGAGLRAGVPSVIVPVSSDQPFWARRVKALGADPAPLPRRRLTAERLADAICVAVTDESMRTRAAALGETIRAEDGVADAVRVINQTLGGRPTDRWS